MKRACVTGANGFIGGHLVPALQAADWAVVPLARDELATAQLSGIDTLFHLAGLAHAGAQGADREHMFEVNVNQSVNLYRAAVAAGVRRFIWLSSIKVLGDVSASPLSADAPRHPGDDYAQSKAAAEEALLNEPRGETQLCIVRPPLVYGPNVQANFLSLLRAANSPWPLPFKSARAQRAWLGVDNLVDLLLVLANSPAAGEQAIWHVRDAQESSVGELLATLRNIQGRPPGLWSVSPEMALRLGRMFGRAETASRLFEPLRVDMQATERLLGWQPPVTQNQALKQVMAWYQTH